MKSEDATHVCAKPMAWWDELLETTGWEHAPDLAEALKTHPDNHFENYDRDWFIARKRNNGKA